MGSVAEIWSARKLRRGRRQHWVAFGEEIEISGAYAGERSTLCLRQPNPGGPLSATLAVPPRRYVWQIERGGHLAIDVSTLRLVVVVRAVEGARCLIEFGAPRGNRMEIALGG